MELDNILDEKLISIEADYKNKDAVLKGLVELLNNADYINNSFDFLEAVYNREKEGLTGIGNLIAIPHGKSESVSRPGIAITTLKKKIEWESLDDNGVQIVFLIAVGTDDSKAHLTLLSQIARKLGNDEINSKLLNAQSKKQIMKILTS